MGLSEVLTMDHPFRKAIFGGFDRQDVMTYLEDQARKSSQEQEQLQQQTAQLQQEKDALAGERDALICERDALKLQLEQLRQERGELDRRLEQACADLSASRDQTAQAAQALEAVERERDKALAELAALTPDAQAYAQLKERTAGMELEAHRRAQNIQTGAEEEAKKLHRQMEQWLQRLEREYAALRSQVESAVSHTAEELAQANTCLERVGRLMEDQEQALGGMKEVYAASAPAKVQAPMPISEQ